MSKINQTLEVEDNSLITLMVNDENANENYLITDNYNFRNINIAESEINLTNTLKIKSHKRENPTSKYTSYIFKDKISLKEDKLYVVDGDEAYEIIDDADMIILNKEVLEEYINELKQNNNNNDNNNTNGENI